MVVERHENILIKCDPLGWSRFESLRDLDVYVWAGLRLILPLESTQYGVFFTLYVIC